MTITLKKFNPNEGAIKPFDCRVGHLNDFLLEEDANIPNARHHARELLAETYVFEDDAAGKTVAYFSLLNDKVERDLSNRTVWNRLSREIPNAKRRQSYPAVKIGRLAVSKDYEGQSFGRISLNYIKQTLLENRVSGCRFVTVDALKEAVGFYQKNGFQILTTPEESDETVLMFFDLKKMIG